MAILWKTLKKMKNLYRVGENICKYCQTKDLNLEYTKNSVGITIKKQIIQWTKSLNTYDGKIFNIINITEMQIKLQ